MKYCLVADGDGYSVLYREGRRVRCWVKGGDCTSDCALFQVVIGLDGSVGVTLSCGCDPVTYQISEGRGEFNRVFPETRLNPEFVVAAPVVEERPVIEEPAPVIEREPLV